MTKYNLLISKTALKQLESLNKDMQDRIRASLKEVKDNPFESRPKADIKKLRKLTKHQLYRLRVGNYRIVYAVEGDDIKVAKIFPRGEGYEWLD